jgi:hypothetical protein
MEQEQDEKDDEYQPDKSRRNVTPSAAMGPPGKYADENQNENDKKNSRQHLRSPRLLSPHFIRASCEFAVHPPSTHHRNPKALAE